MKIKCPSCDTTYDVSEEIANSGAQVQCVKCPDIFTAAPMPEPEISIEPIPEPEEQTDLLTDDEKDFFASFSTNLTDEDLAGPQTQTDENQDPEPEAEDPPAEDSQDDDIGWDETPEPEPEPEPEAAPEEPVDIEINSDEDLFEEPELHTDDEPEPAPEPEVEPEPEPITEPLDPVEPLTQDEEEPPAARFNTKVLMGWGALAASVLFIVLGATFFRVSIVRALPGMAGLYQTVGLPVNVRGLEFARLSHQWENTGPRMRLIVRGEIINITDDTILVPEIIFVMVDGSGLEFFQWTERAGPNPLLPKARTRFRAQIPAPVDRVRQLKIRFAKR